MPQRKIVSSSKKISPAKEILGYVIVFIVLAAMVGIASMTVTPPKESGKYSPKTDISNIGVVRANAAEIEAERVKPISKPRVAIILLKISPVR